MKVVLFATATVDGFIARDADHFTDWSESADKDFFTKSTRAIGTVLMGANTYRTLREPLPGRLNIVLSTSGDLRDPIPGELEFYAGEPQALLTDLEERGIETVALIGGGELNGSFLVDELIDEMFVSVSPLLFGRGISIFSGYDFETNLRLLDVERLGENSAILHYEVIK